jgi:hypothetical protein
VAFLFREYRATATAIPWPFASNMRGQSGENVAMQRSIGREDIGPVYRGVSLGTYATVLSILGLISKVEHLADARSARP